MEENIMDKMEKQFAEIHDKILNTPIMERKKSDIKEEYDTLSSQVNNKSFSIDITFKLRSPTLRQRTLLRLRRKFQRQFSTPRFRQHSKVWLYLEQLCHSRLQFQLLHHSQ
jgi:hypothetical protein